MFATDDNLCKACSDDCLTCSGSADACTSCQAESAKPFLYDSTCLESCPDYYGSSGGKCHLCEYPCETCSSGPQVCTSCSQDLKELFLYGPLCEEACPQGFITNYDTYKCEGCAPGCEICDEADQRVCVECKSGLLVHQGSCVNDCPRFFYANYAATECIPMSNLDVKLVYFPFLIVTVIMFMLSYVGTKQKKKHLLIPNFLIFMGLIEHVGLITQLILTFDYGTWRYASTVGVFWFFYVAGNIGFYIYHLKVIAQEDRLYGKWRNHPDHIWARRIMNILGLLISWTSYKMAYSSCFAIKLTPAKFSDAETYKKTMRRMMYYNIVTTYAGMIVVCFVGLIDLDWGT